VTLNANDSLAGKRVKCPKCSNYFAVPNGHPADRDAQSHATSRTHAPKPGPPAQPPRAAIDARPILHVDTGNAYSKAAQARDAIYNILQHELAALNVHALTLASAPTSSELWVRCEAWLPQFSTPSVTKRTSVRIECIPRDFYKHEVEFKVSLTVGDQAKVVPWVILLDRTALATIVGCLTGNLPLQSLKLPQRRISVLQFWRPANQLIRVQPSTLNRLAQLFALAGLCTLCIGIGIALLLIGVILFVIENARRSYALTPGRPASQPRRLLRLDAWQAMVHELGPQVNEIRAQIQSALSTGQSVSMTVNDELVAYLGVDGKQERRQLVASYERAIVFVHVYQYGQNLFVGWDAHVNCGNWVDEPTVMIGIDSITEQRCRLHKVLAGWHSPTEYDVTDANCLIESVHSVVSRILKCAIADHQIDQEIDFSIQRSDRTDIVGRTEPQGTLSKAKDTFSSMLRRRTIEREA
jgi:hypothetical protein